MLKEELLINNKEKRDKYIDRINVLEQVKDLLLLGDSEFATTQQVADYYEVGLEAVKKLVNRNKEELINNGLKDITGKETKEILASDNMSITNCKGYFIVENQKMSNRNNLLFPKRAILNIGMLLRDSKVAKEVRTRLLDIIHDTEKNNPKIINNIINEIRDEQQIQKELIEAVMTGDFAKETQLKTELIGLKNKRITELEKENKLRSDNATLIQDTRLIINRIVRYITNKRYHGNFKACWDYVYTLANYKLHMNIKKRDHKKNEPLLNTLTYEELQELEIMLRNWCLDLNYNLESILRLS